MEATSRPSHPLVVLLLLLGSFVHVLPVDAAGNAEVFSPSGGPIYVNPAAAAAPPPVIVQPTPAGNYVTQTVYGFLDFTTTIGNTVMVFSPQSVPADGGKKSAPSVQTIVNTVIETKPVVAPTVQPTIAIKPSKTIIQHTEKKAPISSQQPKKLSSVIEIKSDSKPVVLSSVVQVQNAPSSKVNIVEGNVKKSKQPNPIISTNVEVLTGPSKPQKAVFTKVNVVEGPANPPIIMSSHVEVVESIPSSVTKPLDAAVLFSSVVEVHSSDDEPAILGNNIGEPEYDFLSRQPSEFVEETYRVVNLKPSSKFHLKPRHSVAHPNSKRPDSAHPTGLVTKLGGTVVKDGATTVHETSVIGTYISGKYAQVLQSTSHIYRNSQKPKPTPASSLRILKTAAPVLGKGHKHNPVLDPTPANTLHDETLNLPLEALFSSAQNTNLIRPSRRPSLPGNFKNRFKGRSNHVETKEQEVEEEEEQEFTHAPPVHHKKSNPRNRAPAGRQTFKNNKFGRAQATSEIATVSVFSEPATATPVAGRRHYQSSRRSNFRPSSSGTTAAAAAAAAAAAVPVADNGGYTRRGYKPRVQASVVEPASSSTSVYKFKLNRSPGRWQYKTTPKPRVTIRRQNDDDLDNVTVPTQSSQLQDVSPLLNDVVTPQARSDDIDLEPSGAADGLTNINDDENTTDNKIDQPLPLETIRVEISTPADFKDIYFEIATIKSPYTFQVGSVKNTRYITVTSTIEKSFIEATPTASLVSATEPLTENILATTSHYDKEHNLLDSSIATLPAIALAAGIETPPLETMIETFSTTTDMLKTHILPVVRGANDTTSFTLVQTYHITRLVTATKTLPPMEVYQFVPSKTLNEFNSRLDEAGSELHLELEFGDENDDDDNAPRRIQFPSDLDLANIGSEFDLSDVDKSKFPDAHLRLKKAHSTTPKPLPEVPPTPSLTPEQLQQLALLRFLNPQAQVPQVITTSKPVVKLETVFESHVIPIFNGVSTSFSTLSRPVATVSKTEYEYGTSTLPAFPPPQLPTVNPLFPQQQQQFAVTSTPIITQTMVTATDSKVLKLTFGAKTAYTTLFSTRVIPTVLTTYVTASVPVQATAAAFPGFFPAPYPQFPFVG